MNGHHNRYFIELQPHDTAPIPRNREDETRRRQAADFITSIYDWLRNHELDTKVSSLDVTAFGQVRITCDAEIITRIRADEELSIANIRPSAMYVEGMHRRL